MCSNGRISGDSLLNWLSAGLKGFQRSGGLMGLSFAIMWITSMYQMWFYKVPEHVSGRHEELID